MDIKKVTIFSEYIDYIDVFLPDSAAELPKHTGINNHFISLIDDKQPLYGLIYSLELIELETLNINIETNWVNDFIRPFKLPTGNLILFICKKNTSL